MPNELSHRQKMVLAGLSAVPDASFEPVQVQKLFFLMDENIADEMYGKQFAFEPYDYGPFDKAVYAELEALQEEGLVHITAHVSSTNMTGRSYSLTYAGQRHGEKVIDQMPPFVQKYLKQLSEWVRNLSFAELVGAIYRAYPNMRENSIFQEQT